MGFPADNRAYEAWLRTQCRVVDDDLGFKHERMKESAFVLLRATFFRWARRIEEICPDLGGAPKVLAIGDVHVENFGTWRDAEGRLVWGVNDFDEGAVTPYAFDLIRLATSARLAPDRALGNRKAAAAILEGYRDGLANPRPILLDEQETWMREYVVCTDEEREKFWDEVDGYPEADPPAEVQAALRGSLPEGARDVRFASRRKGGGSLGRPRYVAVAKWRGGRIVREAKALVPSAWDWAHAVEAPVSRTLDLATGAHRSPDPHLGVADRFIIRRVAADSQKIELGDHAGEALHAKMLRAMGFDLGAVHAADKTAARKIRAHLDASPPDWLRDQAKSAATEVAADFRAWRVQTRRWRNASGATLVAVRTAHRP
jgi:hypothetical protein